MNQIVKISLISKSYTMNDIGVPIPKESKSDVFAQVYSVSQAEFFNAGKEGLKPAAVYAVRVMEYDGQDEIEVNKQRFVVYRTFTRSDGRIELYVNKRKNTNDIISV